jgi:ketosteroid isomerase-like protein
MNDQVEWKEFVPEHILENGNIVIATGYAKGTARKTKRLLSSIWSMIFEFNEEGKLVHLRDCFDTNAFAKAFTK